MNTRTMIKKALKNPSLIRDFWQGTILERMYYSRFKKLVPTHIREQYEARMASAKPECINSGSCIYCGCTMGALQMAPRACEGLCYPPMMGRKEWKKMQAGNYTVGMQKEQLDVDATGYEYHKLGVDVIGYRYRWAYNPDTKKFLLYTFKKGYGYVRDHREINLN